jgi:hypothetical protein
MSKQLAVSAAFSIFMMATYVLFGPQTERAPLSLDSASPPQSQVQVTTLSLPDVKALLPFLR